MKAAEIIMPNNPGRVAGDYSIGEKEEVKYIDPGNFGAIREQRHMGRKVYAAALAAAAFIVLLAIIYWAGA